MQKIRRNKFLIREIRYIHILATNYQKSSQKGYASSNMDKQSSDIVTFGL